MKHKHAELIKAWADGCEIQVKNKNNNSWFNANPPTWDEDYQYRIKPEEKKPVAWMVLTPDNKKLMLWGEEKPPIFNTSVKLIPLYTAPPSKPEQGCAECGVKASDGYALYCVKCTELFTQPEQEPVAWDGDCVLGHCGSPDGCDRSGCCRAAPPSKQWVSLSDNDITGASHAEARHPVSILETTDSGLCMQFSETGEWHASDKRGDFMKVNSFLMSFARAIEAALRSKNNG